MGLESKRVLKVVRSARFGPMLQNMKRRAVSLRNLGFAHAVSAAITRLVIGAIMDFSIGEKADAMICGTVGDIIICF